MVIIINVTNDDNATKNADDNYPSLDLEIYLDKLTLALMVLKRNEVILFLYNLLI